MLRHEDNLVSRLSGNTLQPLAGISVTVTDNVTGLAASLYSDNGVTPITQAIVTDNDGYFGFYAPDGSYTLTFTGVRVAPFTRQIVLDDPKDNPYATKAELAAGTGSVLVMFTQAGTGAVPRPLQDELRERVSVKQFGAKGDGVADDTAAIQTALDSGAGRVFVPAGTYKTTSTLYVPDSVEFTGQGRKSIIAPSGVTGAAISNYKGVYGTYKYGQHLDGITIKGTCTYGVIWMGGVLGGFRNVSLEVTATHGFIVDGSFGNKFEQLSTAGSTFTGACFWAGADFNANHLDGLYTSNYCQYNFLSDSGANAITGYVSSTPTGHGSTLTNVCCQGGVVGMALHFVNYGGWTINSPYFENCVTPIKMGNGTSTCRSVTINSPFMLSPASGNPGGTSATAILIDNALNITINSPEFGGWGAATDLIQYRISHKVIVNNFYLSTGAAGSVITGGLIKRKTGADSDGGIMVIGEETSAGGFRSHFMLMKADNYGYQHYKMGLTAAGAWQAVSVVPGAAA